MGELRDRVSGFVRQNPWVSIAVPLTTLFISVSLNLAQYHLAKREPRVVYAVNPTRTVIVRNGVSSNLKVLHRDRVVTSDVSVVQIALWNQGRAVVRRERVLTPLRIVTEPPTPILDFTVRSSTRPENKITLGDTELANGVVPVDFQILEQDDGASVQLVYAGGQNVGVRVDGVIEGQRRIVSSTLKTGRWYLDVLVGVLVLAVAGAIWIGLVRVVAVLLAAARERGRIGSGLETSLGTTAVFALLALTAYLVKGLLVLFFGSVTPPFAF